MVAHTWNPNLKGPWEDCLKFKASLGYIVTSRSVWLNKHQKKKKFQRPSLLFVMLC